jgi:hypothetical protein
MYKPLQLKSVLLICVLLVTSCGSFSPLAGTPVTDEQFDAAVEEAHGTLNVLRQAILSPRPSYDFVGLKVRFFGDGTFEDIWTNLLIILKVTYGANDRWRVAGPRSEHGAWLRSCNKVLTG